MSYDEDPLDLLEDDGDGVVEMGLFFDDDQKEGNKNSPPNRGCCVALCMLSGSITAIGFGISISHIYLN